MQDKKSISELAKELLDKSKEINPKFDGMNLINAISAQNLRWEKFLEDSKPKPLNIINPYIGQNIKFTSNPVKKTTPPHQAEVKTNNRAIEKNKKYLEITTMYYTLRDEGKRVNECRNFTMKNRKIGIDTFKRALQVNINILRTKQFENDFKWLIIK